MENTAVNVLVIGSGGREHALCWALARSRRIGRLFCAPGNGGTEEIAENVPLDGMDFEACTAFCRENDIGLVVIGPEAPLCAGLSDHLEAAGIPAFGPSAAAAALEGSKGFSKDLFAKYNIPTAAYGRFSEAAPAKAFLREKGVPIVIKADGLAAGKGVVIAHTPEEAEAAVDEMLSGRFGDAGAELVIEEFLTGEEASYFVLTDGENILPLATAQDHKAVGDGDTGPNTGGMGAYSPAPIITPALEREILDTIIRPTVRGMKAEGRPFKGVLYAGLMITPEGPKVLEYNVRFGDPECQVLMARLDSDLPELLLACRNGTLDKVTPRWRPETAMVVVMAAQGYPGNYAKGSEIRGLDAAAALEGVTIFHAGTRREGDKILANGGRVLGITALGRNVTEAQARAYRAVAAIDWPEGFCRSDIGWRAVAREKSAG